MLNSSHALGVLKEHQLLMTLHPDGKVTIAGYDERHGFYTVFENQRLAWEFINALSAMSPDSRLKECAPGVRRKTWHSTLQKQSGIRSFKF